MIFFPTLFGALFGACLGSFAAAWSWAWMHVQNPWGRRSHCEACGRVLAPWHLVPVLSRIWLRGKCAFCGAPIPLFHFGVELATSLICAFICANSGVTPLAFCHMGLAAALVAASAIDLRMRLLPDVITLGSLVFAPLLVWLNPDLTAISSIAGFLLGALVPLLLMLVFKKTRGRDGLGWGDIKLFALCGALGGWQILPFVFFFSALAGICVIVPLMLTDRVRLDYHLPYGPFISAGLLAVLIFPAWPWRFYSFLGAAL